MHTDLNMLQVCDAKTLEPKRLLTYAQIDPQLAGFGICAHPPKDRKRGWTFNYIINPEDGVMSVFALDIRSNPVSLLWKTPLPCQPCYIHSLAMTERFVVFIRNVSTYNHLCRTSPANPRTAWKPIHMDVSDMTKPMMEMLEYEPQSPTSFLVLDKETGRQ